MNDTVYKKLLKTWTQHQQVTSVDGSFPYGAINQSSKWGTEGSDSSLSASPGPSHALRSVDLLDSPSSTISVQSPSAESSDYIGDSSPHTGDSARVSVQNTFPVPEVERCKSPQSGPENKQTQSVGAKDDEDLEDKLRTLHEDRKKIDRAIEETQWQIQIKNAQENAAIAKEELEVAEQDLKRKKHAYNAAKRKLDDALKNDNAANAKRPKLGP